MNNFLKSYFSLIRHFLPKDDLGASVGIDIGSGDCKLVEIVRSDDGNRFKLVNWSIQSVKNGDISTAIKEACKDLKQPCKVPYTSVFGKGTLIRYIEMPRMSIDDLRNSFAIEADKYFPFPSDQIYTDCFILNPNDKGKKMDVMAAAVKKEMVDSRIETLKSLDFQVNFIGINPVALANIINVLGVDEEQDQHGAIAIFDMGESVSSVTIMVDQLPRFTRDIHIGGRDFTKRISNGLGVSVEEAEGLKRDPKTQEKAVLNACESSIMSIVQELKLSFDYYVAERDFEISALYLTGGASKLSGLDKNLAEKLDMRVKLWDPISQLELAPDLSKEEVQENSLKLGVALGLALYHYD